jgi:hypothetical protein
MDKLKSFTKNNLGILIALFMFYVFIDLQGFAILKDAALAFVSNFEAKYFVLPSWGK